MRLFLLLCFICLSIPSANCQQIYFEGGKTTSSFDFTNSSGETLENLQSSSHSFITIGYRKSVFTKHLYLNLNASYNSYGAIGSDVAFDNYFEWNLNYLGAGFGFDYPLYRPGNFSFYIKAAATGEFLIQGTQTLNNQVYNLSDEEDFDSAIYVFRGGLGTQYRTSEAITVFIQYMYGFSGAFKKTQGDLKIKTHNFGLGLLINISNDQGDSSGIDSAQLEQLKKELDTNSQKLKELEENSLKVMVLEKDVEAKVKEIATKTQELEVIKTSITDALIPYKGNDLSLDEQNGKVRITLENDMLFTSGSWKISAEGEKAVQALGDVLAKNPDVSILIEGHTDNQSFEENGNIINNWDLSVKRATAIVEVLSKNENINPKNLVAAGRGEFSPIADNTTADGRASNRRIEIVLTPKLEELIKLLKN